MGKEDQATLEKETRARQSNWPPEMWEAFDVAASLFCKQIDQDIFEDIYGECPSEKDNGESIV